ncbi:hypothetical protein V8E55_011282 [Tylopilus felleus]
MANTLKQKCTLQTLNEDPGTQAVDSRKRTKTTVHNQESDGPHQTSCQSFRTNMGKDPELREGIQTHGCHHKQTAESHGTHSYQSRQQFTVSRESSGNTVHPSARQAPLPTYQAATEGSHCGFNIFIEGKSSSEQPFSSVSHLHAHTVASPMSITLTTICGTLFPQWICGTLFLWCISRSIFPQRIYGSILPCLEEINHQLRHSLDPPPYTGKPSSTPGDETEQEDLHDLPIDEISPDEDECMAEKVLQSLNSHPGARSFPNNHDTNTVLLAFNTHCIPDDRVIDPVLLAEEYSHNNSGNHVSKDCNKGN